MKKKNKNTNKQKEIKILVHGLVLVAWKVLAGRHSYAQRLGEDHLLEFFLGQLVILKFDCERRLACGL